MLFFQSGQKGTRTDGQTDRQVERCPKVKRWNFCSVDCQFDKNQYRLEHPMRNFPYDSCCVDRDLPHNYGGWYLPHIIFCGISNALLIQGGANIYNVFWIFATRLKPFKTRSPIVLSPICHHLVWYFDPPPHTHTPTITLWRFFSKSNHFIYGSEGRIPHKMKLTG